MTARTPLGRLNGVVYGRRETMPATVNANGLSIVHRGSDGIATATMPDVCKTPGPTGSPTPVPYPNVAMSTDLAGGTTTVAVDGQMAAIQGSKFARSTGDEPGVAGGVVSNVFMMEATFISFSPTVTMDGRPVCRLTDKMLMNRGNTACLGGEMQQPVLQPLPVNAPAPEAPKPCSFEKLTLRCGHESRKYVADAEAHPGTMLQIIAGKTPEKVKFGFGGICGVTSQSLGCQRVHVIGDRGEELKVASDNSVELSVPDDSDRAADDWWSALSNMTDLSQMARDSYTVYGATCGGTGTDSVPSGEYGQIEVFPNASCDGELEMAYKYDKKSLGLKGADKDKKHFSELDSQAAIELKGKFVFAVGKRDFTAEWGVEGEGATKDSDPLSRGVFNTTQAVISRLARFLTSIEKFYSTKLDIRWPSIKIGAGIELVELEETPRVVHEGKFFIEAAPLIGLQIKVDILDWIIFAAGSAGSPALGKLLLEIKERLASGRNPKTGTKSKDVAASLDVGIVLTAGGDVGGGLGWKIHQGKVEGDRTKGRIEAGVDFKLEALIKAEIKVFIVKACGGASVSLIGADGGGPSRITGKVGPKEGNLLSWWGSVSWNGLAVYYAYYAELGGEEKYGEEEEGEPENPYGMKSTLAPKFTTKENKELMRLADAWEWPKPDETNIVKAL